MARPQKLSIQEMFKEMTGRWSPFPNINAADGAYDYFSQSINLMAVDAATVKSALQDNHYPAMLSVVPLLAHELQHFADHTSSVWGREMLVEMFGVFQARISGDTGKYVCVPPFMRGIKTVHFDDYYTYEWPAALDPWDKKPWRPTISIGSQLGPDGVEKEDKPILFTQFARHADRENLCRVPFSIAALLEVRATAAEIDASLLIMGNDDADVEKKIDRDAWSKRVLERLYDPFLATYSVAVHEFANVYGITNAVEAYHKAARVAWLALNLPRALFPAVKSPDHLIVGKSEEAVRAARRFRSLIDICDRGFLYVCLVENARGTSTADMNAWMDEALKRSGLPPLQDTLRAIEDERASIRKRTLPDPDSAPLDPFIRQRLDEVLAAGDIYIDIERGNPKIGEAIGPAPFPPLILREGGFHRFGSKLGLATFDDPGKWYESSFLLYNQLRHFVDACVI